MNDNNQNKDNFKLNQTPLITVTGELEDFIIQGHLSKQITSDLSRESIDWQRNCYDFSSVPVYVEACFIKLDEHRHLLWDFFTKDYQWLNKVNQPKNLELSTSTFYNHNSLTSTLKRHNSFTNAGVQQNIRNVFNNSLQQSKSIFTDSIKNSEQISSSISSSTITSNTMNTSATNNTPLNSIASINIDYCQLFRLIGQRYCLNNGARILLNSYWLDSNYDLESYNSKVRDQIINWFQKILTITACYQQLGLNQDFNMDFFVIIVNRNNLFLTNTNNKQNNNNNNFSTENVNSPQNKTSTQSTNSTKNEQLLNLSSLINETKFNSINNWKKLPSITTNKIANKGSNLTHSLSSSMSSLNGSNSSNSTTNNNSTTNPIRLTHQQLVDQIRNDLMVCFQLFKQNFYTNGTFDQASVPANSKIAAQLIERIIIFDSTSNSSQQSSLNTTITTSVNHSSSTTNPIISSTARTFSALSNLSASSISKTMSPTKSSKSKILSSVTLNNTNASILQSIPILNYSQFICKIRHFLMEFYTRQFECFERLIRHYRELRNEPNWDYFGFFLIQEELAFAYESLGLYKMALIQYDELDALFSQLVLDSSHTSGFGAPLWLQKRLLQNNSMENLSIDNRYNCEQTKSTCNTWTGLCLCNQESMVLLRLSLVQSILASNLFEETCSTEETNSKFESNVSIKNVVNLRKDINRLDNRSNCTIQLLDFRNYLYSRQCYFLCLMNKPWELASRALPFLQTSVSELTMLEISMTPGGIACWVFLSALEILHKCERYSDSSQLDLYSYYTVGLWSYARDNLIELGKICNLLPEFGADNSKKIDLHRMVELVAGMGTDPHIRPSNFNAHNDKWMSPQERLKDALSSSDSFIMHYLEITKLTMGTYKHIGNIRCARFIGKQLAELYLILNKPQQALPFLLDLYHMFEMETWSPLKRESCRLLAQCLEHLYINMTNTLQTEEVENKFNLEPIIRNAFRTNLLLLVKNISGNLQLNNITIINNNELFANDDHLNKMANNDRKKCLNSMFRLINNYQLRGAKLKNILMDNVLMKNELNEIQCSKSIMNDYLNSPLLVIHNSQSDLFYDDSLSVSTNLLPSPCNTNSNGSLNNITDGTINKSNLKLNSSEQINQLSTNDIQCEFTCNINNKTNIAINSNINNSPTGNNRAQFFEIENIDINYDSTSPKDSFSLNISNSSNRIDNQSFISGSLLKLRLNIISHIDLNLKLDHILITLKCSRNDPSLMKKNSNEMLAQNCTGQASKNQIINDPVNIDYSKNVCYTMPAAQVESYYCHVLKSTGIRCLNGDSLLTQTDSTPGHLLSGSFDGYHKFMSQVQVPLINQQLSNDDYLKYYRFLTSTFKFETKQINSSETDNLSLQMIPGTNQYDLIFVTPENLYSIVKQLNLQPDSCDNVTNVNQLWFTLDQLILFCHYENDSNIVNGQSSIRFAIIEHLANRIIINNFNNRTVHNVFRLVKCPPSIELISEFDQNETNINTQNNKLSNTCFIGIEQAVHLNINSGTNQLPKGLKCFVKINLTESNSNFNNENVNDCTMFDNRLVNVTLHKNCKNENEDNENCLEYFHLDRHLKPFETYKIMLWLRSSYTKSKFILMKGTNKTSTTSHSWNLESRSKIDQYEFKLSLYWTDPNDSSNKNMENASCYFSLLDPFHLNSKIFSCGTNKKLFQVKITPSNQLHQNIELYFCYPILYSITDINGLSTTKALNRNFQQQNYEQLKNNGQLMEPINVDQKNNYKLMGKNNLNFVWHLDKISEQNINRLYLELSFMPKFTKFNNLITSWVKLPYHISIMYNYQTRYTIRQWIEPVYKNKTDKNSEIIRIGHSCLLRAKIERIFFEKSNNESYEDNNKESIMCELICDPNLWGFVSVYLVSTSNEQLEQNELNNSALSGSTDNNSGLETATNISTTNSRSRIIKFNNEQSNSSVVASMSTNAFETAFEIVPLKTGYIPIPNIRISLYKSDTASINKDNLMVQESERLGRLSPLKGLNNNSETPQHKSTTSAAIETFSALITENLSLSGKTLSKYLLSNNNQTRNAIITESNMDNVKLDSFNNDSMIQLKPFEPGQVYNYSRSSQVYVLPGFNEF